MKKTIRDRKIVFGTGGWRAIIGDGFDRKQVEKIAQALAEEVKDGRILVSYDRRFLSKEAAIWATEVFTANNLIVYFVKDPLPTPISMFYIQKEAFQYGITITASHNPAAYNGIKIFVEGGQDAPVSVTDLIAKRANALDYVYRKDFFRAKKEKQVVFINPSNDYIDHVLASIDLALIREAELKILLDPMYGVSKTALSSLMYIARCDVDVINEQHDAFFGGQSPSPELDTLEKLQMLVRKRDYHLGIATDGDADRVGLVDEKGQFIHPNILIALIYHYLLTVKKERGPIVRNLATTHLLDKIAQSHGEYVVEVPVGFKHISDAMLKHEALIGGESSGGITIRNHIRGKDGIFSAMILLEILAYYQQPLSEIVQALFERYGSFYSYEKTFVRNEASMQALYSNDLPQLDYHDYRVSFLDGFKVVYDQRDWLCVRPSGTEDVLRVIVEAESPRRAYELMQAYEEFLFLEEKSR